MHLVRQRAPRPELASVRDVIYQRSTDGGKSWSEPRTLNDDDPAGLRYHGIPNITAAPNGRIDVAWWDTRHDEGARVNDVYYASSADDGLSWTKNIRITDRSVDRSIGVWGFNFDMSTSPGRSTHRDIGDRPGAGDSGLSGPTPVRSRSYSTTQADLQES